MLFSLLLFIASSAQAVVLDRLEASVNASIILKSDVKTFRTTMPLRAQLDPLFAATSLAKKGSSATDAEIIEFLVDEKVIASAFPATDSDVEQAISRISANSKVDRETIKNEVKAQGFSFEDYFEIIRVSKSKHDLIDREIRMKLSLSEDDIRNYYLNHYPKSAGDTIAYHIQLIFVANRTYKTPALARSAAQDALQAIKNGEPFGEVAKRVSDDPNGQSGGDLGLLTESQMNPLLREQAKKLKDGEMSGVFGGEKSGGFYILKVQDRSFDDTERYNRVKDEIRNQLAAVEYQRQVHLWLERQRQTAFVHKAGEPTTAGLPLVR